MIVSEIFQNVQNNCIFVRFLAFLSIKKNTFFFQHKCTDDYAAAQSARRRNGLYIYIAKKGNWFWCQAMPSGHGRQGGHSPIGQGVVDPAATDPTCGPVKYPKGTHFGTGLWPGLVPKSEPFGNYRWGQFGSIFGAILEFPFFQIGDIPGSILGFSMVPFQSLPSGRFRTSMFPISVLSKTEFAPRQNRKRGAT